MDGNPRIPSLFEVRLFACESRLHTFKSFISLFVVCVCVCVSKVRERERERDFRNELYIQNFDEGSSLVLEGTLFSWLRFVLTSLSLPISLSLSIYLLIWRCWKRNRNITILTLLSRQSSAWNSYNVYTRVHELFCMVIDIIGWTSKYMSENRT